MLLAEELLLLAFDSDEGRPPLGKGDALKPGLSGALLCELALRGKVSVADDRVEVVDRSPTGDDLLDEVLGLLGEGGGRRKKVKGQVKALARSLGKVRDRVARRLVAGGTLSEERRHAAGLVPVARYPVADRGMHQRLRDEVRRWVNDDSAPPDPRLATLVALLGACQLLGAISDDRAERRRASARARAAMKDNPAARAVKAIVEEVATAAAAVAVLHG